MDKLLSPAGERAVVSFAAVAACFPDFSALYTKTGITPKHHDLIIGVLSFVLSILIISLLDTYISMKT